MIFGENLDIFMVIWAGFITTWALLFVVLAIIPISNKNIVHTKLTTEISECSSTQTYCTCCSFAHCFPAQ